MMAFVVFKFALSAFHFAAAHIGPRPYVVLVLSLIVRRIYTQSSIVKTWRPGSDKHPEHERALRRLRDNHVSRDFTVDLI